MLGCSPSRRPRKLWPPNVCWERRGSGVGSKFGDLNLGPLFVLPSTPFSLVVPIHLIWHKSIESFLYEHLDWPHCHCHCHWSWPDPLATWSSLSPAPRPRGWSVRLHESQSWQSPLNPFINLIWFSLIFFFNLFDFIQGFFWRPSWKTHWTLSLDRIFGVLWSLCIMSSCLIFLPSLEYSPSTGSVLPPFLKDSQWY